MSRTTRWWFKPHVQWRFCLRPEDCILIDHDRKEGDPVISLYVPVWKQWNPRYYRHELKILRVKLHKQTRRGNKVRLQKGWDYEPEVKTNGWMTH